MVIYNAGTDILDGDPLGHMRVSAEGVAARDEAVFEVAPLAVSVSDTLLARLWRSKRIIADRKHLEGNCVVAALWSTYGSDRFATG